MGSGHKEESANVMVFQKIWYIKNLNKNIIEITNFFKKFFKKKLNLF